MSILTAKVRAFSDEALNFRKSDNFEEIGGPWPPYPSATMPLAILDAFRTLTMDFVDCSKIVLLKQMIAGTVVKKKNDCKESTYPEPAKKGADLSAFLCEATACKNSEMFPC